MIPSDNDKNAMPLDSIIDFAWASGADMFWVNNAKDELKKLREEYKTSQQIQNSLAKPVAYAKIDSYGNLYDLRTQNNPYNDQSIVIPLYTPSL